MKRNILFLDIDSVLNYSKNCTGLYDSMQWISDLEVEKNVPLFKENVNALRHIINNVQNLGIVWSTDWRYVESDTWKSSYSQIEWKNPAKWLESQKWFNDFLIGKTPKKMSSNRFEEIHFWFVENIHAKKYNQKNQISRQYYDIANYAIIDDFDSPGMKRYGSHFFKCNYDAGLTLDQAKNIVEYLKIENFNETDLDWENHE